MNVQFSKDRTDNWKSYFPVRNGVKPESFLKPNGGLGRNYTNETLYYMSKARIARTITDKTESYLNESPYFLIDMTAGIGGNTLEFLSRKNCSAVMSFERDPIRRLMLQRNIQGYKLDDKAIVVNGENSSDIIDVTGEEDFTAYNNAVFFFDPPWLPANYKYSVKDDYKKYYIKKDAKVGNLTLEEWLTKLTDTAYMVIFRMPPGYYLNSVPGWSYVVDELGNDGRLITCIPNQYIKGSSLDAPGEIINTSSENFRGLSSFIMKLTPIKTELAKQYEIFRNSCNALSVERAKKEEKCKFFVRWGFNDPYPENQDKPLTKLVGNLALQVKKEEFRAPIVKKATRVEKVGEVSFVDDEDAVSLEEQIISPSGAPSLPKDITDKDSAEWVSEFQGYINWILNQFIKGPKAEDTINNLLQPECMQKWIQAFTEETFMPDRRFNYDILEIIGDRAIEYVFSKILIDAITKKINDGENIPSPDAKQLTNYKKEYMSDNWQILTGKALKLTDWIRIIGPIDDKKNEDLFESFIGALVENGDKIRGVGMGIYLCIEFLKYATSELKIKKSLIYGDPITQFIQRFEKLYPVQFVQKKGTIEYISVGSPPNLTVQLQISKELMDKMSKSGFIVPNNGVLGIGKGSNFNFARKDAADKANKFLDGIGLTVEYVKGFSSEKKWDDIRTIEPKLVQQVKNKVNREGYTDLELETENTPRKGQYISILKATDSKGVVQSLSNGADKDVLQSRLKALRNYLDM